MENKKKIAHDLLRYYNMEAGTACRLQDNEYKINLMYGAFVASGEDYTKMRHFIKDYIEEHGTSARLIECFGEAKTHFSLQPAPQPQTEVEVVEVKAEPQQVSEQATSTAIDILGQAVTNILAQTKVSEIESQIMNSVEDKVRNFIKDEYGSIERKITTVVDGVKRDMKGIQHDKFETVLKFVANDEPVYLTGPAGSGKNVLCKQVADALGLNFYFTNAVTQEYKLTGFTDAMGTYQPTQFYKAFTEGGVFMLDEMDASIPEVLVILNSAIANRYFDFPAPIGYVEARPDFRVIAAGNTIGQGADFEYCGRNQLDGASLDRFAIVKVDYSEAIENSVAGDIELADFCRDFRQSAHNAGLNVIVSYRAIGRLAKMLQLLDITEALNTCLIKGLERDDINIIVSGLKRDSKYSKALRNLAQTA